MYRNLVKPYRFGILSNRYFLLFFFVLGINTSTKAAKVFINLNIDDCANCSLVLKNVISLKSIDSLDVVLPSKFERDHNQIIDKFGFKGIRKVNMKYSDSLSKELNELSNHEFASSIFVFNTRNTLIFQSLLKGLDLGDLNFYCIFSKPGKLQIENMKDINAKNINYFEGTISLLDHFNNLYFYDMINKKENKIIMDSILIKDLYKEFFGNSFYRDFPIIQRIFKYSGNMKPEVESVITTRMDKKSVAYILYTIRSYEVDKNKDTTINMNQVIYQYDLSSNKGQFYCKNLSQNILKGQNFGGLQIFIHNKLPHLHFYTQEFGEGEKNTYLATLIFGVTDNKGEFSVDETHASIWENNYLTKVGKSRIFSSNVSANGILYTYADSIYVIDTKVKLAIPFAEKRNSNELFNLVSYNHFYNPTDKSFTIYYIKKGSSTSGVTRNLIQFTNKGELIADKSIEGYVNSYNFETLSFIHPYQIVGIDGKNGEILLLDL